MALQCSFGRRSLYSNSSTIPVAPENVKVTVGPHWGNDSPILLPATGMMAQGGGSSLVRGKEERFGKPKGISTTITQTIQES